MDKVPVPISKSEMPLSTPEALMGVARTSLANARTAATTRGRTRHASDAVYMAESALVAALADPVGRSACVQKRLTIPELALIVAPDLAKAIESIRGGELPPDMHLAVAIALTDAIGQRVSPGRQRP